MTLIPPVPHSVRALHVGAVCTFFDVPPAWARFAAIDESGAVWVYEQQPEAVVAHGMWREPRGGRSAWVGLALKDRALWQRSLVRLTVLDQMAPMRAIDELLDEALEDDRPPVFAERAGWGSRIPGPTMEPTPARVWGPVDPLGPLAAAQRSLRWRMFALMLCAAGVLGFVVVMAVTVVEALL